MNLYFRFLLTLIASLFKPRIVSIMETSVLKFRVWPNDLDFNMHMNNGRYLTVMDLGRLDLILRSGLIKAMLKQKSVPVLGASTIRYRIPLNPFQEYELQTKMVCWDEKWAYMEQRFVIAKGDKAGAIAAVALVKGSFFDQKARKTVPTSDVIALGNMKDVSPPMPIHVAEWIRSEEHLKEASRI